MPAKARRISKRHDLDLAARIGWSAYVKQRRKRRAVAKRPNAHVRSGGL